MLSVLTAINERFHPLVVVGVRFHQINDVEPVSPVFASVLDSKIIPLRVALSPIVVFQIKIVLKVVNFDGSTQVARFKSRLEN